MKKLLAAICVLLVIVIVLLVVLLLKKDTPQTEPSAPTSVSQTAATSPDNAQPEIPAATTETAAPETAVPSTAAPSTTAARNDAWKQAYSDYLSDLLPDMSTARFALIYVDNDDTPELAYCEGSFHVARWTVLTYRGGSVREIGDFGGWGNIRYYEKAAMIYDSYGNQGQWEEHLYRIENGKARSVWEATGEFGPDGDLYYDADGNPLTEAQYNAQFDAALPANAEQCARTLSYDEGDGMELTTANIAKALR